MDDIQNLVLAAFRKHNPDLADHMLANQQSPWWAAILNNTVTNEELAADIRTTGAFIEPQQSYTYRAGLELALMRLTNELPNPPGAFICQDTDIVGWKKELDELELAISVNSKGAVVSGKYGVWSFYSRDTLESFISGVKAGEDQAAGSLAVTILQALGEPTQGNGVIGGG